MSTIPPTESPDHSYVKPGQVNRFHEPPDNCMRCGAPAAVHPATTYSEEASVQDQLLDRKLMDISMRLDDGDVTPREAAAMRVAALTHHLEAVRELNAEWFGE